MNLPNLGVGDFTVGQPCAIVYPTGHIDFAVFIEMRDDMPVFTFRNLASPPAPVAQPEPVVVEEVLPPSRIVLPEAPPRVVKPTAPPVDCSRMTRDQLTAYLQKVLAECEMSEKN